MNVIVKLKQPGSRTSVQSWPRGEYTWKVFIWVIFLFLNPLTVSSKQYSGCCVAVRSCWVDVCVAKYAFLQLQECDYVAD